MFSRISGGNGRSDVNGPPGAACINKNEIIKITNRVGIAIAIRRNIKLSIFDFQTT